MTAAPNRNSTNLFAGCLLLVIAVAITSVLLSSFLYVRCLNRFDDTLFAYPNAQIVRENYTLFAPLMVEFYTADSQEAVSAWLQTESAARMRQAVVDGTVDELLLTSPIVQAAQDRIGSTITFTEQCL
jgi:hypothetical protein